MLDRQYLAEINVCGCFNDLDPDNFITFSDIQNNILDNTLIDHALFNFSSKLQLFPLQIE
jgi:hypothetical protein